MAVGHANLEKRRYRNKQRHGCGFRFDPNAQRENCHDPVLGESMKQLTSLSQDEQKKMRERMLIALCLDDDPSSSIIQNPSELQNRIDKLKKDFQDAPVGSKMNNWVRNIFSTKTEAEFLLDAKLREIKAVITASNVPYSDYTLRLFGPAVASVIYEIYRFAHPLVPIFKRLLSNSENMEKMVRHFLDRRMPGAKTSLMDFISIEEMKNLFFRTESRLDLVFEINERLNKYFSSLPEKLLTDLAGGMLPMYYFKNVVTFPYEEFFQLFGHIIPEGGPVENPVFQAAQIHPVIDYLEKMFCVLHPLKKIDPSFLMYPEILQFCAAMKTGGAMHDLGLEDAQSLSAVLRKQLENLLHISLRIVNNVPIAELIRYYKSDPYYKLLIYLPKLRLKEFYTNSLRLKVFEDFEDFFSKVRFDILEDMIQNLFGSERPVEFEFYMNSNLGLTPKAGYQGFSHNRSINILYNFIRLHYRGYIQNLVHLLNRVITNRLRESFSTILIQATGIEDVGNKIKEFDLSFSPDADDGKTLIRLKFGVDKDLSQQKLYRVLIAQKNKEATELLEKGLAHIEALVGGLSAIQKDGVFITESSKRIRGLEPLVQKSVKILILAGKTVRHLIALEQGSL
jgi:hypothetical protein